jgi:hypothetical protein
MLSRSALHLPIVRIIGMSHRAVSPQPSAAQPSAPPLAFSFLNIRVSRQVSRMYYDSENPQKKIPEKNSARI